MHHCSGLLDTIAHVHRFIDAWLQSVQTADAGWLQPFRSLEALVDGKKREDSERRAK